MRWSIARRVYTSVESWLKGIHFVSLSAKNSRNRSFWSARTYPALFFFFFFPLFFVFFFPRYENSLKHRRVIRPASRLFPWAYSNYSLFNLIINGNQYGCLIYSRVRTFFYYTKMLHFLEEKCDVEKKMQLQIFVFFISILFIFNFIIQFGFFWI